MTGAGSVLWLKQPTLFTPAEEKKKKTLAAEAHARELNANQTSPFLLGIQAKQAGLNFPHSRRNDSATRRRRDSVESLQTLKGGREKTSVLSASAGSA